MGVQIGNNVTQTMAASKMARCKSNKLRKPRHRAQFSANMMTLRENIKIMSRNQL